MQLGLSKGAANIRANWICQRKVFVNVTSGALFEYSVILLQMKIKTIRQIRKCMNGNLAAYLSPLVRKE